MAVRIYDSNYIDPDTITSQAASSEQAAFPASNLLNFKRRSKVWRSDGYFNVTSSNRVIVFSETTSVDLGANIAIGEYTSRTAFYAAVKAALEVAGASTYTVEADATTLKTKITSNGAGGGGILDIDWEHASTTAESLMGFTTDDTGALTYTADTLSINTSEWITWDFGTSYNPTAFALIGQRNEAIKISPTATIKIQGNATDAWTSPTEEITLTYQSDAIHTVNSTGLWAGGPLRYARLYIEDTDNSLGYIEVGACFLGDYLAPVRGRVQYPLQSNYIDNSVSAISEGGQTFTDVKSKTQSFSVNWNGLTTADKESIDSLWIAHGTSQPFFVEFDPDAVFSSSSNKLMKYVRFQTAPTWSLISPGNFTCRMDMKEEL